MKTVEFGNCEMNNERRRLKKKIIQSKKFSRKSIRENQKSPSSLGIVPT